MLLTLDPPVTGTCRSQLTTIMPRSSPAVSTTGRGSECGSLKGPWTTVLGRPSMMRHPNCPTRLDVTIRLNIPCFLMFAPTCPDIAISDTRIGNNDHMTRFRGRKKKAAENIGNLFFGIIVQL